MITSINGTRLENAEDYTNYLADHPLTGETVTITYERDGLEYTADVTPKEYRTAVLKFSYNACLYQGRGLRRAEIRCSGSKISDPLHLA